MARMAIQARWLKLGNRFCLHDADTSKVYYVTDTTAVSGNKVKVTITGSTKTKFFTMPQDYEVYKITN